jgi:hypothetical protein
MAGVFPLVPSIATHVELTQTGSSLKTSGIKVSITIPLVPLIVSAMLIVFVSMSLYYCYSRFRSLTHDQAQAQGQGVAAVAKAGQPQTQAPLAAPAVPAQLVADDANSDSEHGETSNGRRGALTNRIPRQTSKDVPTVPTHVYWTTAGDHLHLFNPCKKGMARMTSTSTITKQQICGHCINQLKKMM